MANNIYAANSLLGGTAGALDDIDHSILSTGDAAIVVDATNNIFYFYTYDSTSDAVEASPTVINPDSNSGDGRWIYAAIPGLQSSTSDSTANSILKIGAFGLGGVCITATGSWDSYVLSGFYMGDNLTNTPTTSPGGSTWWNVLVIRSSATYVQQIAFNFGGNNIYYRSMVASSWGSWYTIYNSNRPEPKNIHIYAIAGATALATGNGKAYARVPTELNGMNITAVSATVITTSSSGTPTIQIARGRQAAPGTAHAFSDVLSTRITIDAGEYDSKDASAAAVIDTDYDDLATGDLLRIDVDVAGTGTTGLIVNIKAETP